MRAKSSSLVEEDKGNSLMAKGGGYGICPFRQFVCRASARLSVRRRDRGSAVAEHRIFLRRVWRAQFPAELFGGPGHSRRRPSQIIERSQPTADGHRAALSIRLFSTARRA